MTYLRGDTQLDIKYALLMSSRLKLFKVKSTRPYRVNFRCPICNDSKKSATKSRGWLLESAQGGLYFKCHNCHAPVGSLYNFLKSQDPILFRDYVAERFIESPKHDVSALEKKEHKPPQFDKTALRRIKKISQLPAAHPAREYINSRQIPTDKHYLIYYAPKFTEWINSIIPDKLDSKKKDEPRLILPFLNEKGECFGVSARSFDPNAYLRYITIMFDDTQAKIFGRSTVNWNRDYKLVEGAVDSLFLDNAIAMAGADGNTKGLKNIENLIFIFDREPRNKEVISRMTRVVAEGHRLCIWPSSMRGKDINEFILNGYTKKDLEEIIKKNTFKGLEAKLMIAQWKQI